jgi:hypothetical protein
MNEVERALLQQFLTWVGEAPRSYGEAMAAWRTHCPRMTTWEDAVDAGLIEVERGAKGAVRLTEKGRALVAAQGRT